MKGRTLDKPLKVCNTCGRKYMHENDFLKETTRWRMCERGNLWFNCGCNSTNMIIKGKFPWYSPDMNMSEDAKSVFNTLPALQELPHLPTSVMELQQLIRDDKTSSSQLARVSKKDPLIASNILKIANNLKAGGNNVVIESLEHAISYIGLNSLSDIVLTASIKAFPFETKIFKSDAFWDESFLTGKIAENLSRKFTPGLIADEVYLAGALANVGKVVLAICFPLQADKIAQDCQNPKKLTSWRQGEENHNTYDHSILGEIAASFWGLPEYIMQTAAHHHKIPEEKSFSEEKEITDVVRLANQLTHWVSLEPNKIEQNVLDGAAKAFGLSNTDLDKLAEELMEFREAS